MTSKVAYLRPKQPRIEYTLYRFLYVSNDTGTMSRDATLVLFMVEKQTHALKTKTLGEECSLVRSINDCNIERILHGK